MIALALALGLGALLAQAMPGDAGRRMPVTVPAAPPGAAVILNSGSTNASGFTIVLTPDGAATVRQDDAVAQKIVGAAQTRWLFEKLRAAGPLDALALEHCMKSASFGTFTHISYDDRTSGDISCGGDSAARELARTVAVIVRQLDIDTRPHAHRLRTF
jgi:hypothetical protein